MPFWYARSAALCGPSVRARLLCLRSKSAVSPMRAPYPPSSALLRGGPLLAGQAAQPRLLPLRQAPEVAAHLLGVDLAAGQVHVGLRDEVVLVAGQGHPLGQRVVGVGQARGAVGARLV